MRLAITLLLASAINCANSLPKIFVDPYTGHFVDEYGRVRLFRGINSVVKHDPWYDPAMLTPERVKSISDLGFNVVRLGNMWTGYQPESSANFNMGYVDILQNITRGLESNGVYTLLDMHQDVLWQAGPNEDQGYWGVPPWLKHSLPKAENLYPWPFERIDSWPCGYFTQEILKGFEGIFANTEGTGDDLANFWGFVAQKFKDEKGILGYELINEPFTGDLYSDLSLILPGVNGKRHLEPLYNKIHDAIRTHDDESLIFWEAHTWAFSFPFAQNPTLDPILEDVLSSLTLDDAFPILEKACGSIQNATFLHEMASKIDQIARTLGFSESTIASTDDNEPSIWSTGLKQVPGGPAYLNRTVLSWHYYCWAMAVNGGTDEPYPETNRILCDEILGPDQFNTLDRRAKELGQRSGGQRSATMLTEFGLCHPNVTLPESTNFIECNFVMNEMDKRLESWTYWDSDLWDVKGQIKAELAVSFARPYPRAVAGQPLNLTYDVITGDFRFSYDAKKAEAQEFNEVDATWPDDKIEINDAFTTEVFVPELAYTNKSYEVEVSDDLTWTVSESNPNVLLFKQKATYVFQDDLHRMLSIIKLRRK